MGPYNGHLSSWGETIELSTDNFTLIETLTYSPDPSDSQRYLRITELMYHPAQGGAYNEEEYEYIELKNIGTEALSLDGVKISSGFVRYDCDVESLSVATNRFFQWKLSNNVHRTRWLKTSASKIDQFPVATTNQLRYRSNQSLQQCTRPKQQALHPPFTQKNAPKLNL